EGGETAPRAGIHRDVGEPLQEPVQLRSVDFRRGHVFDDGLLRQLPELVVIHLRARRANDAGRLAELTCALALVERRQQLALGKVSGRSEDNKIKGFNRNYLARHAHTALEVTAGLYANRFKNARCY